MHRLLWFSNLLMGALFVFAATLQFNDPDPLRWAAIYFAAAAPCWLALWRPLHWPFPAVVGAIALAWSAAYAARGAWSVPFGEMFAEWEMKNQQVVETREMFGLLIVAGWMLVLMLVALARRSQLVAERRRSSVEDTSRASP